jgi:heme-degrading monooxygenase HmoA
VIAAMSTIEGPASGIAEISRMAAEDIESWLRGYEGYRGLLVLTDESATRSRVITLWDTPEHEQLARESRGAMRDMVAAAVGMSVIEFEVYEVAVCDVVG